MAGRLGCRSGGIVYLVGAGPGDPGLITLKGLKAISIADVILVDRLIPRELLSYAKPGCEIIYVGKEPGGRGYTQDEINRIMVERAMGGEIVVRLKGGDPIVFGRGGEEMEILRKSGVCYEVVPGVSSIYAVPAYAGIPITHRRFSSSVAILPGREAEGKERNIDLAAIARVVDTIVILMGVARVGEIVKKLISGGIDPGTPVAVIEKGTTEEQRTLVTTLERLPSNMAKYDLKNPSLIIIGKTALLAEKLCWYRCGQDSLIVDL